MAGENLLWESDYIRRNMRDSKPINLSLVPRPAFIREDYSQITESYRVKVNEDDANHILIENDFEDFSVSSRPWNDILYFPLRQLEMPYKVRICGVDNLMKASVPLYDGGTVRIRTLLYYGLETVPHSQWETSLITGVPSSRWMQWLDSPEAPIMYKNLPRATRVAFLLCTR
eukprot:868201_1